MISFKSIDLEELRKDPNASTAIKKSKIGEGVGTKVLEILEEYKDVLFGYLFARVTIEKRSGP